MAENLNPFEGEEPADWIEDEIKASQSPNAESPVLPEIAEISWDGIASKLLKDNFILTALELHTELVESGRELPRLRDYFSNPGNFERTKEDTPSPTLRKHHIQMFGLFHYRPRNKGKPVKVSSCLNCHTCVKYRLLWCQIWNGQLDRKCLVQQGTGPVCNASQCVKWQSDLLHNDHKQLIWLWVNEVSMKGSLQLCSN